jgi:hypothetical protein
MVSTQFNTKVKCIRSATGNEFKIVSFYHENGIEHQNSCVATPQQNGIYCGEKTSTSLGIH